jgi:hypothetical protein
MVQERGEAPPEARFLLRRREWAYLLWTLASVGYGLYAHFTVLDPSACPSVSRAVVCRAAAEGALGWAYVGLSFVWLFGLGVIWFLAWLIGDEIPHRREMKVIDRERAAEPRRF